ncbi:class II fructose-bisphosphatase [Neobacillus sp. MM2021_6]|uniref:class II fructose-bisphosphatase n=1 Tax=Bacillaceae TaxID=186817 RepID=UPI001409108A|nr:MULTISPECIES: class II fructose-bisphosphatase [Bacillaceae]MBO0958791.1 class II fructose-bisphosphatase [Neobacillus sp. MM2021_6]NHC20016.1 class II fructose-bisphosphatase [Bacillus sp. MM2020_4]
MQTKSKVCTQGLVMDFLAVTQQAAIASFPWIGKGNKLEADGAGTAAMRTLMNAIDMRGKIVIGEGEMDEAPMLYINEELGTGIGPMVDIAVDPVEGTTLMANGQGNSLTVIAVAERGSLLHAPDMYMKKIAVGPKAKGCIDIELPLIDNMRAVAKALGKDMKDLTVMMQDRPRHNEFMNVVIAAGASIKLFSDVDITGAIGTAIDGMDVDLLVGTGGAPEGVIAATALKCLGGDFQAILIPQDEAEYNRCIQMGIPHPEKPLTLDEIVKTEDCFFVATGITDGLLLDGVKRKENTAIMTHSLITIGGDSKNSQYVNATFHTTR